MPTHSTLQRRLLLALGLMVSGMLVGCSSFERQWRQCQSYAYPDREIAGCWEGEWHSELSHRAGRLRAIITKDGENSYNAHFRSTYAGVIPYEFDVPLQVTENGEMCSFEGEEDLGRFIGGICTYAGNADDGTFQATYITGDSDHGSFELKKVQECSQRCVAGMMITQQP